MLHTKESETQYIRDRERSAYKKGVKDEQEAWMNGLRCSNCGGIKDRSDLWSLCEKCTEEE